MRAAVDCYCGAGGASCGLASAGFNVRLGLDWDEEALSVYRANHAHTALQMDLAHVSRAVDAIRSVGDVDVVSGSPPCQDFSMCSDRRVEGARASLTVSFARVACAVRPRCVLVENVPQMLVSDAYQDAKRMLVDAGYSVLELRVNSAACGVAQVRRRVFVLAVRDCDPTLLQQVREEAEAYSSMPSEPRTVRDCLRTHADTYFYPARSRHMPTVRSTDRPAPTLTTGCLALPPSQCTPRHDDAGALSEAHVLRIDDAARIASFPSGYFDAVTSRRVAGRLIGNCVPPAMMQVVASWCMRLVTSPAVGGCSVTPAPTPRSNGKKPRMWRLVEGGLLDHGAVLLDGDTMLLYVCGDGKGDAVLEAVLGWRVASGWQVQLMMRREETMGKGQFLRDDLLLTAPGVAQPFRSYKQAMRSKALSRV